MTDLSSLDPLFSPKSIAVIGASDTPTRIGGRPIAYTLQGGFAGPIYPVNPGRPLVQGLPAFSSIRDVGHAVDLAIIAVPGPAVPDTVRDCAAAGVRSAVIFSAGFAEAGGDGASRQSELAAIARDYGMRILGPNSVGLFNAHNGAFPTFSVAAEQFRPKAGSIAIASQSGGYAGYVLMLAGQRELEVGKLITTGNECDVDVGETIEWLAHDPNTSIILAYIEGCRNGQALIRGLEAAQRAGKPVVAIKVGSSEVGAAAAASHTAALAGADEVYNLVFERYGVYRARHTEEMLDVAYALERGGRRAGRSIGLITVSGGIGVHMTDLASEVALDVPDLPEASKQQIRGAMTFATPQNPLDVTGQVANQPEILAKALDTMLGSGAYDAILIFLGHAGAVGSLGQPLADSIKGVVERYPDRLVACCSAGSSAGYAGSSVLFFPTPPRAIAALAACLGHVEAEVCRSSTDTAPGVVLSGRTHYSEVEAKAVLGDIGVDIPFEIHAADPKAAGQAADRIGGPVALKIVASNLLHKTDVGGVMLGLESAAVVEDAAKRMLAKVAALAPDADLSGFLVSPMLRGFECLVGVHEDPMFGPVVLCGAGGVTAELMGDVSRRLAPVDEAEAVAMLRELKSFPLLDGFRGTAKGDVAAAARAIAAISRLAVANGGRLAAMEVNPLLVQEAGRGAVALDCVITLRETAA